MDKEQLIEAMRVELEGCKAQGLTERVAHIEEQLALLTGEPAKPVQRSEKRPARRKAEER